MTTLRVIIKGDKYQAARAAADRGIPFVFDEEIAHKLNDGLTTGRVGVQFQHSVAAWFCEPPTAPPFPIGACLHYATVQS